LLNFSFSPQSSSGLHLTAFLVYFSVLSLKSSYKRRFGIEEMFRDFKKGGDNLEAPQVKGERLI
jgi:hypothetical protein